MALANAPIQVGWGSQWEQLASGINSYYGGGITSSQYQTVINYLNSGNYTVAEMEDILGQIPEMQRTYNSAGQLTGVSYNANVAPAVSQGSSVASQINSNVAQATSGKTATVVKDVQNITVDSQTGKATISNNVTKYTGGVAGQAKAVASSAVSAICAASVGINLGKTVDSALYNANPQFWDSHGMSTLNPQTWATITQDGDGGFGDTLFNFIFQIDTTTGNPQPYVNEDVFAYMTAYMVSQGVFDGAWEYDPSGFPEKYQRAHYGNTYAQPILDARSSDPTYYYKYTFNEPSVKGYLFSDDGAHAKMIYFSENTDFSYTRTIYPEGTTSTGTFSHSSYTHDGHTIYFASSGYTVPLAEWAQLGYLSATMPYSGDTIEQAITTYIMGTGYRVDIEGIDDQTGATVFDDSGISDITDINSVKTALQTQYPELWENRIEYSTDGQNKYVYVPVGFPTGGTGTQPTTNGATQADTSPQIDDDGDNVTDELIKTLIEMITLSSPTMSTDTTTPVTPTGNPNPPDTGTGDTPVVVIPTGSASALWKIYNPSQAELDTFGAWLWSSNFVDQLLKVFNDPMQAIIGLHKIFVTPSTSGSGVIKVGYLSSNATANYVDDQYVDVDCGTIDLTEYFGNVFDYDPYTKINLFLPFIGFVPLSVSDCMRGSLGVVYHVDVLTGSCLAEVSVTRDLHTNVLYTFSGNCAVQYPVSSGSYVGIVTGLLGMAGGIAGTIASGGALAPAMMGIGASVGQMHTSIAHSGNVSSNAGAMGIKKPYVVIERPQTALPQYYDMIEGEPQNEYTTLSDCTGGFVKVKTAIYNINAERVEIEMLRTLLESGVYI